MRPAIMNRRLLFVLLTLPMVIFACNLPSTEPSPPPAVETQPLELPTAMPTKPGKSPPKNTHAVSPWERISGTWSGCSPSQPSSGPTILTACTDPRGQFITLYLLPTCDTGELCGNYIKAAFESEYIRLQLTLLEIQGSKVRMYGDAGDEMFAWASTEVEIERVGADVLIREATGERYVLLSGCDPVIEQATSIGCYEHVP